MNRFYKTLNDFSENFNNFFPLNSWFFITFTFLYYFKDSNRIRKNSKNWVFRIFPFRGAKKVQILSLYSKRPNKWKKFKIFISQSPPPPPLSIWDPKIKNWPFQYKFRSIYIHFVHTCWDYSAKKNKFPS